MHRLDPKAKYNSYTKYYHITLQLNISANLVTILDKISHTISSDNYSLYKKTEFKIIYI